MPLSKHLHRFAEGTSMHGFRNVVLSKRPQKRIAWFIVFLCAWTLFAYQITSVVTRYFQYPKRTITQVVAGGVPFPAVTKDQFLVNCIFARENCKKIKITFDPYYFNCFTFDPPYDRKVKEYSQSLSEGIDSGFSATVFTGRYLFGSNFAKYVFSKIGVLDTSVGVRVVIHPPGTRPFPLDEGYDIPPGRTASLAITPRRRTRLKEPYGRCTDEYRVRKGQRLFEVTKTETRKSDVYRKLLCERNCIQEQVVKNCSCLDEMLPVPMDTICFENKTCTIDHLKFQKQVKRVYKSRSERVSTLSYSEAYVLNECRGASLVNCADMGNRAYNCSESDIAASLLQRITCAENITEQYMTDVSLLSSCECDPPCNEYLYDVAYSLAQWPPSDLRGSIWLNQYNPDYIKFLLIRLEISPAQ